MLAALCLYLVGGVATANDCIRLERVEIAETRILDAGDRSALTASALGSCIDGDLLRRLLADVSNHYLELGYVTTRPYLREQDISDGAVEIDVVVGTIEAIVDAASGLPSRRIDAAFLFRGELLNLRSLESALETLQRVESVSASFDIRPGSRPGGSIVAIRIDERDPLRLQAGINAQTERDEQLSLRLMLDNALDLNDLLELRYNSGEVRETLQSDRSREIAYSLALGELGISLSRSDIEFDQRVQGINESFLSTGDSVTDRLRIDATVLRGQRHRFNIAFTLELKDSNSFFEGQQIDVSSYRTSQAQLELQQLWLADWGQLNNRYIWHQGLDSFGARDDDYYTLDNGFENEARLQFDKFVLDSHLLFYLGRSRWDAALRLYLQYSDDILFASDQLSLGSPYTVRGYPATLSGSNAGYLRAEMIRRLTAGNTGDDGLLKRFEFSVGLDYGEVRCEVDNPDVCGHIYSLGAGFAITDANFSGRLVWGHPLRELEDDIGDEDQFFLDLRWTL